MITLTHSILSDLSLFYSTSQQLDILAGKQTSKKGAVQLISQLQNCSFKQTVPIMLGIQSLLLNKGTIDKKQAKEMIGLNIQSVILAILQKETNRLQGNLNRISVQQEMVLRLSLNILRILITFDINLDKNLDQLLLKLISYSLDAAFMPIRKVSFLLGFYLYKKFQNYLPIDTQCQTIKGYQIKESVLKKAKLRRSLTNPVQAFYASNIQNLTDSRLAQVLVVGLLRALLSACPQLKSQQSGVDINRQWNLTLDYHQKDLISKYQSQVFKKQEYQLHNYKTACGILSTLSVLICSFFKNCPLQATYLIQLIADANGILVLLKFISDKFLNLQRPLHNWIKSKITVYGLAQMGVQMSLNLLCVTSLKYPQRIQQFHYSYNTYIMLSKLPHIFPNNNKIQIMCYQLIKAQVPYFNEKMKQYDKAMKIITHLYCKNPPKITTKQKTPQQRLRMKLKIKISYDQPFSQLIQIKAVHVDFNNYHYWKQQIKTQSQLIKKEPPLSSQAIQKWLQQNVY